MCATSILHWVGGADGGGGAGRGGREGGAWARFFRLCPHVCGSIVGDAGSGKASILKTFAGDGREPGNNEAVSFPITVTGAKDKVRRPCGAVGGATAYSAHITPVHPARVWHGARRVLCAYPQHHLQDHRCLRHLLRPHQRGHVQQRAFVVCGGEPAVAQVAHIAGGHQGGVQGTSPRSQGRARGPRSARTLPLARSPRRRQRRFCRNC